MTTKDTRSPTDPANQLLNICQSELLTAVVGTPVGQRTVLTIRTPSTTLSVFLEAHEISEWAAQLTEVAGRMSKAGLFVPQTGAVIHNPSGNGQ